MNLDEFAQKFQAFRFRTKSLVRLAIAVSSNSKRSCLPIFFFLEDMSWNEIFAFFNDFLFCVFVFSSWTFFVYSIARTVQWATVHSNGTASFLLGAKVPCIRLRSRSIPILWQSAVLVLHTRFLFFLQGTTSSCQQDPCLGSGLFTGHTQKTIQIAPGDLMGFWVEDHQATAHAFLFVRNLE